ncbi:MAG: SLBB domain-containing protein [Bacteroidales bacterium]|nr:SLBB domain-containing protein [Bacteroidales bacterium]
MQKVQRYAILALAGLLLAGIPMWAQGSMTDEQVTEYVKKGLEEGKSKETLMKELTVKGVTRTQAMRIYAKYQGEGGDAAQPVMEELGRAHSINEEFTAAVEESAPTTTSVLREGDVYGRDIFRNKNLNFSPSENLATPRNYRLGPGDEVIIDVFGRNQTTLRSTISPEGSINVDVLGPLYLNGMTVDEANTYLKKRLSQIYGGLSGGSGTDMRLSLGQIRSIQVNVLGDVTHPGTYVLSAFASAFHALYRAGGVQEPGTLRNIKVVRGDKVVGTLDVYEYLSKGSASTNIRLEEGDVILVSPYKMKVSMAGGVKRPMSFEMKEGETLADLIEYSGGFLNGYNSAAVTVYRQNPKGFEVRTVEEGEYGLFKLKDGDRVEVGLLQSLYENRITVQGAVYFPGTYELSDQVHTAKQLIEKAGGLLPEAYTDRVVVHREHEDRSMEVFSLNLTEVMAGSRPDFALQNNDEIYITSNYDLKEQGTMTISGMVKEPGEYPFAENTTIEDFIIMAGGLLDGASTSRVDVTRRKKDTDDMAATQDIGVLYTFSLDKGLADDGTRGFVLEPYDEVVVHRSPSYNVQRHFSVSGEVNFPGGYSLTNREEHVTDLLAKAGGLTPFAYKPGARLIRRTTDEEQRQGRDMVDIMESRVDTADVGARKALNATYSVAIDLDKALAHPGGDEDVVLREGDELIIPGRSGVVRVHGSVLYPTAVNYDDDMRGHDYIEAAGGFAQNAARSKAYVVNMGGRAKRLRAGTKVEPGAEIYVPKKEEKKRKVDPALIVAIGTASSSISTLAVVVYNIIRNTSK